MAQEHSTTFTRTFKYLSSFDIGKIDALQSLGKSMHQNSI